MLFGDGRFAIYFQSLIVGVYVFVSCSGENSVGSESKGKLSSPNFFKEAPLIGIMSILLLSIAGCGDTTVSPDEGDNGGQSRVGRAHSVKLYSGINRLMLTWPHLDSNVSKTKVYWNNQNDFKEKKIASPADTVKVHINNIKEGEYIFEIFTFDENGNRSAEVQVEGKVYGYVYNGPPRSLANFTYQEDHSIKLEWKKFSNTDAAGTQVSYTNSEGHTKLVFFDKTEMESRISDVSSARRGTIKFRTVYPPSQSVLDTLFTKYEIVPYVNRKAVFDSLPGWKFRCKVLVEAKTMQEQGGLIAFKEKMDKALLKSSKKFQVSGLNDKNGNEIHFYMTKFKPFEGVSRQFRYEKGVNDETLDLTVVVNDNAADDDLSWGWLGAPYLTLGHDYKGLFGPDAIDALVHELGHARGMYDLYLGEVTKASKNPVSGQTYKAKKGIMNHPYGESRWSGLSQFIINESAGNKVAVQYWNYFPDTFQIVVRQKNGASIQGAKINLYPVGYKTSSNTVRKNDVIMYRGTTDASGAYDFGGNNPFAIGQDPSKNVFNFLVSIRYKGRTEYRWMPMSDALLAGSKGKAYMLNVKLGN